MCAILGRITPQGTPPGQHIERGLKFLARRGPDSHRVWISDDRVLELLHTRLAIVDGDVRASQPMENAARQLVLIFNGEIYNYRELRQELAGYEFRTESDTEVILAVYALHGVEGFSLLKGMFTLVLADQQKRRVFLARDAIGKKPLFWARWQGQICFGSSLLAMSAIVGGRREIQAEAVKHYWKEGFIRPDQAIWDGASPVLPGEIIELDWTGAELGRHRHYPRPARIYEGETLDEVIQNLDHLLEQALNRRLQDNPSPAVLCSGGIDSTLITLMAARLEKRGVLEKPFKLLTLGAMLPLTNDERYARYVSWRLGKKLEIVQPRIQSIPSAVLESLNMQDEPLGMISFFPLWRLVRAVSSHSRILLSGEGGDELFMGYAAPKQWHQDSDEATDSSNHHGQHVPCGPVLPSWMNRWGRSMNTDHLVGHSFTKVDRASAEQAVEIRCPFLDWDLVCYARSLPYTIQAADAWMKPLLKRLLQGWPSWFVYRPKMGFTMNLRYLWGLSNYAGLREAITMETVQTFSAELPESLRQKPQNWSIVAIFKHFPSVWKLLAWSLFLMRSE